MCNKIPYATRGEAREAAKGIGRQHKETMSFYFCDPCNAWHLRTEGKFKGLKRDNNKYPFRFHGKVKKKR